MINLKNNFSAPILENLWLSKILLRGLVHQPTEPAFGDLVFVEAKAVSCERGVPAREPSVTLGW